MCGAFDEHGQSKEMPVAAKNDTIERSVLAIGLEQPIKAKQRRQQRRDPKDRRSDPGKEVEIRAYAERDDRHHREKEKDAGERAAAGPHAKPDVAQVER